MSPLALVALVVAGWTAASVVTALGAGWIVRRFPPPDHSPRESSPEPLAERDLAPR